VEPGLVDWRLLALFCLTEFVFSASPGPAVLLVAARAYQSGFRASLAAIFGVLCGNLFYFALSATALGAVIFAAGEYFFVAQWCGAAYLAYLATARLLRRADAADNKTPLASAAFRDSLIMQLANPKTIVFFIAFLPLFVNPQNPLAPQVAALAAASFIVEFAVLCGYAHLAGRAAAVVRNRIGAPLSVLSAILLYAAAAALLFIKPH
jgi:homoserine/homoserine lactone efflux protein